nr:hypothetical protein [uncultured Lachnoanaerobaculum sp.]
MLKIGEKYCFEDDLSDRQSCLIFDKESGSWSVDIGFKEGDFYGELTAPSICINSIYSNKSNVKDLIGESFIVNTLEECDEREDTFYIYESEPMISYKLEIIDIKDDNAHIRCTGVLIVDGYADPIEKEYFEIDSLIPIIESVDDWKKFEL